MHPEIREISHEFRSLVERLERANQESKIMSQALNQAVSDLATATANLKTAVDNGITFIQSVPNLIQNAISSAANDADAVAAIQTVITQLKSDGDAVTAALQNPTGAPAPTPAPATPPAAPAAS